MRTVQLDENAGGKKLRDYCNGEQRVQCFLLPPRLKGGSDCQVASFGAEHGNLTVTFDRTFACAAAPALVRCNPGLFLLRPDDGDVKQITAKSAPSILKQFKSEFPDWDTVPWRNSWIEVTPSLVYVYCTLSSPPARVGFCKRSDLGWQDSVRIWLNTNAQATALSGPES
jgi:hypothetical protein